jgi:hypothetical protein
MKVIYQPHAYHELLGSKRYKTSKLVRNLVKKSCMWDAKFVENLTKHPSTSPSIPSRIRHVYLFQLPNVADVLLNRSV